jgi:hypothetical protein
MAIKSGPVLVPESPAPILVPIPRHPTEVGADIIQSALWPLVGANQFALKNCFLVIIAAQ